MSTLAQRVAARHLAMHLAAEGSKDPEAAKGILNRALEAQKHVTESKKHIENVLKLLPEDKNAPAVVKILDKMLKGFEKDIVDSRKTIRDDSKASAPEAIKKFAAAIEKGIKAKLDDPKKLQVIPWVGMTMELGVKYKTSLVILRLDDPTLPGYEKRIEITLSEDPRKPGVVTWGSDYSRKVLTSPAEVVTAFLAMLRGWSGLKGEGEANATRKQIGAQIISALNGALKRRYAYDTRPAEFASNGLEIEGSYRSNYLPKEGESAVGEYEYHDMVKKELADWHKILDPVLKPFEKDIKKVDVHTGEKSWVYTFIHLK